jgi:hypothetical protein
MSLILDGTNGLSDVDGTAATPAIRGTDTNTGIFFPAADTIAFSEGGTEVARFDSSGNLGIGITTPFSKLSVSGGIASVAGSTSGSGTLKLGDPTDSLPYVGVYRSAAAAINTQGNFLNLGGYDGIAFAVGPTQLSGQTERMRIDSSGNLLVGTASQNGAGGLTVSPNLSNGSPFVCWNRTATGVTSTAVAFRNGGTDVGLIQFNNTSTAYITSSDYRLKENVAPMTGALAKVSKLKPVTYNWKIDGSAGQGFIAHELQAVVPDCVTGEKDAVDAEGKPVYQGIDTSFLVATLTAAIQELKAELDSIKATVDLLSTEVATLKA